MDFDPDDHSEIIYGPEAAKKEALRRNTGATYLVAETYAIAGLAMYRLLTWTVAWLLTNFIFSLKLNTDLQIAQSSSASAWI